MAYRVEVGPKASAQLSELDSTIGSAGERKKRYWLHIALGRDLNGTSVDVIGTQLRRSDRVIFRASNVSSRSSVYLHASVSASGHIGSHFQIQSANATEIYYTRNSRSNS